jgi:hypothetical protein
MASLNRSIDHLCGSIICKNRVDGEIFDQLIVRVSFFTNKVLENIDFGMFWELNWIILIMSEGETSLREKEQFGRLILVNRSG